MLHTHASVKNFIVTRPSAEADYEHECLTLAADGWVSPVDDLPKRKTIKPMPVIRIAPADATVTDIVVAQRLAGKECDRPEYFPGKRYALEGGLKKRVDYNMGGWFSSWGYEVSSVDDLDAVDERVSSGVDAHGAAAYIVYGAVAPWASSASHGRTKHPKTMQSGRTKPQGMVDAARRWLVVDVDKLPNLPGVDPRLGHDQRAAAVEFIRSFLPPELSEARTSWRMSGSTCVFAADGRPLPAEDLPQVLGAHLRFWLDTPLDEAGRQEVLSRTDMYVQQKMLDFGIPQRKNTVDVAPATYNQAIFLCSKFEDGLVDPIPVRRGISDGRSVVRVATLLSQLPLKETPAKPKKVRVAKAESPVSEVKAAKDRKDHDKLLAAARKAKKKAHTRNFVPVPGVELSVMLAGGPQQVVLRKSRAYKLEDIGKLMRDRRARLPDWSNGVPDGSRRAVMWNLASLLSHMCDADKLNDAVRDFGLHVVTAEWLEEYLSKGGINGIISRAREAEKLEADGDYNQAQGLRVDPWRDRLMALFSPTEDEMRRLGLQSLCTDAIRKERERREKGVRARADYTAERKANSVAAVRPWKDLGISERTWFRRQRAARPPVVQVSGQTMEAATNPMTAMISDYGLTLIWAYFVAGSNRGGTEAYEFMADGPESFLKALRPEEAGIFERILRRSDWPQDDKTKRAAIRLKDTIIFLSRAWYQYSAAEVLDQVTASYRLDLLKWLHENDRSARKYGFSELRNAFTHHEYGHEMFDLGFEHFQDLLIKGNVIPKNNYVTEYVYKPTEEELHPFYGFNIEGYA